MMNPLRKNRTACLWAFLPAVLLFGAAVIGGAFAAGTRYSKTAPHSSEEIGLPDEELESPLPPAILLNQITGTLQRRCSANRSQTITLTADEVARLNRLAFQANLAFKTDYGWGRGQKQVRRQLSPDLRFLEMPVAAP